MGSNHRLGMTQVLPRPSVGPLNYRTYNYQPLLSGFFSGAPQCGQFLYRHVV